MIGILLLVVASGCATSGHGGAGFAVEAPAEERAAALAQDLSALSGPAGAGEATEIARIALATVDDLRRSWRPLGPPLFNNLLVNMGYRERGLCYQWANDLLEPLEMRSLRHFDLRWATSFWGSRSREHNAVVITARGRPFQEGIVLDAWRQAGRLIWLPVVQDRKYPWRELTAEELAQYRPVARRPADNPRPN